MSDGNTPIQVGPTAEEIMNAQNIFQRAADAILSMTQLAKDVESLRGQVSEFQSTMERLRRTNDALEESLSHSRRQREQLEADLSQTKSSLHQAEEDRDRLSNAVGVRDHDLDRAKNEINDLRKQRDDAEMKAMELEEELKTAKAKLERIEEGFNSIFGDRKQPEPAKPEPDWKPYVEPPVLVEPKASRRVYEGEEGFDWGRSNHWDSEQRRYYNEVA